MRLVLFVLALAFLTASLGCATVSTPTLVPESSVAVFPALSDIPACTSLRRLPQPLQFEWPGEEILNSVDTQAWSYYSCLQSATSLAALYREKMKVAPYNWLEMGWVEREEGTLGIYFHTGYQRWLYTWFLPDKGDARAAHLVLMWREADWPVALPCCAP